MSDRAKIIAAAMVAACELPEDATRMIRVWRFEDAPEAFRALSGHGGDEDWVAHLPPALANEWIEWLDSGSRFGRCDVSEHALPDGSVVKIGAHA
jgi:hypothetical protein